MFGQRLLRHGLAVGLGLDERWYAADRPLARTIVVPYAFQSRLSGIADTSFHDTVWYRRAFDVPAAWKGRRVLLRFGAVDYEAMVWVNGQFVGRHEGGHTPFAFDVTPYLNGSRGVVTVRAWDLSTDSLLPRGKQFWKEKSEAIWYTRTSGIWQPVWLEAVPGVHVERLRVTPDVDRSQTSVEAVLNTAPAPGLSLRVTAKFDADVEVTTVSVRDGRPAATLTLRDQRLWSPERPALYDLGIETSVESLLERLNGQVRALRANTAFGGFCYTQLTDVEQEINGLMTYDRKPKVSAEELRKIFAQ